MLKRLYLDNCFTHQDRTFTFDKGVTGIIGPNESGKSLITEMIRYALFGTAALRGQSGDYKDLHVELDFSVHGRELSVVRKKRNADLFEGEEKIATGTKPVNEKIREILGYDLIVFDVANACNQGNVEALSNMRPGERKQMVDRTIGLDILDEVIKFCGEQANLVRREAAGFERVLQEPEMPSGDDHRPTNEIEPELDEAKQKLSRYSELKGQLANVPEKPKKPKPCAVKEKAEVLREQIEDRQDIERKIQRLTRELEGLQVPNFSPDELNKLEEQWDQYDAWVQKKRLLDQGENECPSCGHTWPLAADELEAFADVEETDKPEISRGEIRRQRDLLENDTRIDEIKELLNSLQGQLPDDVSEDLQVREQYEAELAAYNRQYEAWKSFNADLEAMQAEFDTLDGIDQVVRNLEAEFKTADHQEKEWARYEKAKRNYDRNVAAHQELIAKANAFGEARKAVQNLKLQVKTHLLPSLNKVASVLLSQMTGGERYEILVDENFEIMVDGQAVNTLSGSGKAVANIAIRLALGQILTNKVFSVFMADEVDASMDDDRASYTAEALRRLNDTVDQVILVTHKRPETDWEFALGPRRVGNTPIVS